MCLRNSITHSTCVSLFYIYHIPHNTGLPPSCTRRSSRLLDNASEESHRTFNMRMCVWLFSIYTTQHRFASILYKEIITAARQCIWRIASHIQHVYVCVCDYFLYISHNTGLPPSRTRRSSWLAPRGLCQGMKSTPWDFFARLACCVWEGVHVQSMHGHACWDQVNELAHWASVLS
jgi:hypothetical protein